MDKRTMDNQNQQNNRQRKKMKPQNRTVVELSPEVHEKFKKFVKANASLMRPVADKAITEFLQRQEEKK